MKKTHIYLATDSKSLQQLDRVYAYLITAEGSEKTVFGSGRGRLTRHRAHLQALTEAMHHFTKPCEITIHSDNTWVLNMIRNPNCLDRWEKSGLFSKQAASGLKDWDLWQELSTEKHGKTLNVAPGSHNFEKWMISNACDHQQST